MSESKSKKGRKRRENKRSHHQQRKKEDSTQGEYLYAFFIWFPCRFPSWINLKVPLSTGICSYSSITNTVIELVLYVRVPTCSCDTWPRKNTTTAVSSSKQSAKQHSSSSTVYALDTSRYTMLSNY